MGEEDLGVGGTAGHKVAAAAVGLLDQKLGLLVAGSLRGIVGQNSTSVEGALVSIICT